MTSPSLIVLNGRVLTLDDTTPRAEAVAITGDRIVAVGGNVEIKALATSQTEIIDASGRSVLPGFSENHMHLFSGAAQLDHLQLFDTQGFEALRDTVRAHAAKHPHEPLLYGQSCNYTILGTNQRLDRKVLDKILPDRPLLLVSPDHHTAWTNTIGLEKAGLIAGAKLNPGNEVVMGDDGLANGELREGEAITPVTMIAGGDRTRLGLTTGGEPNPYPSPAEFEHDLTVMKRGLDYCASFGITSIHNMDGNLYQLELLSELFRRHGHLPCRVRVPFHFKNFMEIDALNKAELMRRRYDSEWIRSGLVKVFFDGVLDSWTAVMIEPYADLPGVAGDPLFSPARFAEIAVEADRRGLQIAVHAIGDGAVCAVLDGYEAAAKTNGTRDARHRIEHVEVVHPDDIPRFAKLGVIASMQPPHPPGSAGLPLEPTVSRIGRARWPYSYAWRTLKNAGARIAFASDWPVSPVSPFIGIEAAITRKPWADGLPDQSFTLHEALAAYAREGAYAEFAESWKGMIRPGYAADLTILDGDIQSTEHKHLHRLAPALTVCGGHVSYRAGI
ncbi:MAG: amidohydrolase [Aestuariivirga sp.]